MEVSENLNVSSRYGLTILLGVLFAVCIFPIWTLEGRWFFVTIAGLLLLFMSMMFIDRLSDVLMIVFLFSIPLSGFTKWLFIREYPEEIFETAPLSGAIGIGLMDFIIIGLYLTWFSKIFITRTEPLPRLEKVDLMIAALIIVYAMSLMGAPDLKLGLYAIVHLIKHAMVFFYISRNFNRSFVPWFIVAIFFAIFFESAIGIMQSQTGMFKGLILDKGAGGERLDFQYTVPGIEGISRGTGTLYDSHSLGLYLAMLLPYPFVFLLYSQNIRWLKRIACAAFFFIGLIALVFTYSRAGWLSTAISLSLPIIVFLRWREKHIIPSIIFMIFVMLIPAPWVIGRVFERFSSAPPDLMTARYDQFTAAFNTWKANPFFGFGVGNYMLALDTYNTNWSIALPVHNVFLWLAADTGIFGIIFFYGIIFVSLRKLWIIIRKHQYPYCRIALAVFTGLVAYILDGLTNPLFRESTVYMMFWILIAMSVALTRIYHEKQAQPVNT